MARPALAEPLLDAEGLRRRALARSARRGAAVARRRLWLRWGLWWGARVGGVLLVLASVIALLLGLAAVLKTARERDEALAAMDAAARAAQAANASTASKADRVAPNATAEPPPAPASGPASAAATAASAGSAQAQSALRPITPAPSAPVADDER